MMTRIHRVERAAEGLLALPPDDVSCDFPRVQIHVRDIVDRAGTGMEFAVKDDIARDSFVESVSLRGAREDVVDDLHADRCSARLFDLLTNRRQ